MHRLLVLVVLLALAGGLGVQRAEAASKQRIIGWHINKANRKIHKADTALRFVKAHRWSYKLWVYNRLTLKFRQMLKEGHRRLAYLKKRLALLQRQLAIPPHKSAWDCIHRYEGSWTDPNPPYYGGLQMDWGFMSAYGGELLRRKGTADHWTPLEQMWVAENALRAGRGFYPWPNTARMCGLI